MTILEPPTEGVSTTAPKSLADRTHALYRFFGEAGDLLYVGITHHPDSRWRQHRGDKPWWHEVRSITIEPHADRPSVLAAERAAIKAEAPKWNAETIARAFNPAWIGGALDDDMTGTIATYTELDDGLYIALHRPVAATVDALVDLRYALRDHWSEDGKPLVITVPKGSVRGAKAAAIFGGKSLEDWDWGVRFTARFRVKTGRPTARALDAHFENLLCEVDA